MNQLCSAFAVLSAAHQKRFRRLEKWNDKPGSTPCPATLGQVRSRSAQPIPSQSAVKCYYPRSESGRGSAMSKRVRRGGVFRRVRHVGPRDPDAFLKRA
ncbi:hypothetical protein LshimejAT787_0308570 [Lyophyllum shimeji]|uniref:Uncharacterized protein n=1 Tax=Lyophyllum shimeji TaxID=47721 RepID=A0A9P3PJG0_LYOSH|nr:hypothetical protein LshimejAT787_0308570 [Lyophyllum shimeji]